MGKVEPDYPDKGTSHMIVPKQIWLSLVGLEFEGHGEMRVKRIEL